jgi:putative transposase
VTASTLEHASYFHTDQAKELVEEHLLRTAREYGVSIIAYVIMSTHIHFVGFFPGGGPMLSKLLLSVKGRIRKDLIGNARMWATRSDGKLIKSLKMLVEDIEYIHYNPVKAGLVENKQDYRYSSSGIWEGIRADDRISMRLDLE